MNYRRAVQKAQAYRRRSVRWGGVSLPGDVLLDKQRCGNNSPHKSWWAIAFACSMFQPRIRWHKPMT